MLIREKQKLHSLVIQKFYFQYKKKSNFLGISRKKKNKTQMSGTRMTPGHNLKLNKNKYVTWRNRKSFVKGLISIGSSQLMTLVVEYRELYVFNIENRLKGQRTPVRTLKAAAIVTEIETLFPLS